MKPTVAVDLDGVLATYTGWRGIENIGEPIPGAVEFVKKLSEVARVLIFTTRTKEYPAGVPGPSGQPEPDRSSAHDLMLIVKDWLEKWGFPYEEIYTGQGKPCALCYIDDRAVTCQPQEYGKMEYDGAIRKAKGFISHLKPSDLSPTLKAHEEDK